MNKLVLIAVLAGLGYVFATPHITVVNLKEALEHGDSESITKKVDFEAVRANAKAKLKKQVDVVASTKAPVEEFIQNAMAATIEASVNTMVTPENLAMLVDTYHEARTSAQTEPGNERKESEHKIEDPVKLEQSYKDVNHFEARFTRTDMNPKATLVVTLTRKGFVEWQVTDFNAE